MQNEIQITAKTQSGESLYVMVYSASWFSGDNHYEVYRSPEYRAYYIPNDFRGTSTKNELTKLLVLLRYTVWQWLIAVVYQWRNFFGRSVFDPYFKYWSWSPHIWVLGYGITHDVIEVAETFNDQYHFSLQGQLFAQHEYLQDFYLQPSQQYLEERLTDLLMDYIYEDAADSAQTELAINYFEWVEKQKRLGRQVYYICSLDT